MNLYRDEFGHWTGTQADAKTAAAGAQWALVEVPVDKAGLIAWLNEYEKALQPKAVIVGDTHIADFEPAPLPPPLMEVVSQPPVAVDKYRERDFIDVIHEADHKQFAQYFEAMISRLGALRLEDFDALTMLRRSVKNYPSRAATERGLGALLLGDVE